MPHVLLAFFASQLFVTPPIPTQSFDGQTIIVTGASAGLGLACTTHLARLNALRVILAVRSLEKGERARKQVETAVPGCKTRLDVWQLDLSSFESIRQFATRVNAECPQVNGLVQNAGILTEEWRVAEGMEEQAMVHAVGPNLLALMIRNKLAESAKLSNRPSKIVYVGSDMHHFATLQKWADGSSSAGPLKVLEEKASVPVEERNKISKLLIVLTARELSSRLGQLHGNNIVVNITNPGFCRTENHREFSGFKLAVESLMEVFLGRSADVGSRMLVAGLTAGNDSQGAYMSDATIRRPSEFVLSDEGKRLQVKVWQDLMTMLDKVEPGVAAGLMD